MNEIMSEVQSAGGEKRDVSQHSSFTLLVVALYNSLLPRLFIKKRQPGNLLLLQTVDFHAYISL